jgi:hypothetical protein
MPSRAVGAPSRPQQRAARLGAAEDRAAARFTLRRFTKLLDVEARRIAEVDARDAHVDLAPKRRAIG